MSGTTTAPLAVEPRSSNRDWRDLLANPGERDHTVQLYSDDGFLTNVVCHYAGTGLWKGEAVLLVVTPSHRDAFLQRLRADGIDVERRRALGQLTLLDAADTLSKVLVNGVPDPALFLPFLGGVIDLARVRGGYPRVRAYGEMVNLLWEKGNLYAALQLEALWNALGADRSFSLHCAYAMDIFDPAIHCCNALHGVHHTHSHLIPVENYARLDQAVSEAMKEVMGTTEATALKSALLERRYSGATMPSAQDILLCLAQLAPSLPPVKVQVLLSRMRSHYNASPAVLN